MGKSSTSFKPGGTPWNKGVKTGRHSHNWNGGTSIIDGYPVIYLPDHPRANMRGYVREHILVCEKALGKPLPEGVEPHHVDISRDNNAPNNLVLCEDRRYHMLLHIRTKALTECGNANWRRCSLCRRYDDPINMVFRARNSRNGNSWHHNECRKLYRKHGAAGFQCETLPFEI